MLYLTPPPPIPLHFFLFAPPPVVDVHLVVYWQLYLVAENRVLKISIRNIGSSESSVELFFGPEPGEIIGLSVSTSSSCVLINVKNRGLFAYRLHGQLLWSAGPVLYQSGYRQGCRKNVTECYFTSVPVIDHCEASIYVGSDQSIILFFFFFSLLFSTRLYAFRYILEYFQ